MKWLLERLGDDATYSGASDGPCCFQATVSTDFISKLGTWDDHSTSMMMILGGVTVELSRGDAVPRGWILPRCLHLHVSRCMHSGGIIPNLERSGMNNPPWMCTQGIGNYSSMIQGTNEK